MNSLPTLVNSKNCINKETSTQKRLNRKYDIHHDKPCMLSIWIQPLSLSLSPLQPLPSPPFRYTDELTSLCYIAP